MTKSRLIPMLVLAAAAACSDAADTTPDAVPAPGRQDTLPDSSTASVAACGIDDGSIIDGDGIGRLRVGTALADVREECAIVSDTTGLGVEGTLERRIEVDLRRDIVEAVLVDGRVWRVHVDGKAFRTPDGLGVGSTVADLRRDRTARVMPGEGSMYVALDDHCGLSFRLSGVPFGRARPVAELPADGRVVEVLAFGCEAAQP